METQSVNKSKSKAKTEANADISHVDSSPLALEQGAMAGMPLFLQAKLDSGWVQDSDEREAGRLSGRAPGGLGPRSSTLGSGGRSDEIAAPEAASNVVLQRQHDGFQLPPPLSGTPSFQYHLDPSFQIWADRLTLTLDPSVIAFSAYSIPIDTGAATPPQPGAATPPQPGAPTSAPSTAPATPPASPAPPSPSPPIVLPGARPFSVGVLLAQPEAQAALNQVRDYGLSIFNRMSTGEKVTAIGFSAVVAATALGPLMADPAHRASLLGMLNGRIYPVPFTPLNVEVNLAGDNFILGLHLDVGRLLPPSLGFGRGLGATPLRGPMPEIPAPQFKKEAGAGGGNVPAGLSGGIEKARGSGAALEGGVRGDLERGLDADLSGVRVHADSAADSMARSVHARAFTTGNDIFFRSSLYDPHSSEGRQLLAHETVHTLQQATGKVTGNAPGDPFEREADATAAHVAAGSRNPSRFRDQPASHVGAPVVQRQPDAPDAPPTPEQIAANRLVAAVRAQVQSDYMAAVSGKKDQFAFTEALAGDLPAALGDQATPDQTAQTQELARQVAGASAGIGAETYDFVSAAALLTQVLGLPRELTTNVHEASYGTGYFISAMSGSIANFVAQGALPNGNPLTPKTVGGLSLVLSRAIGNWDNPYEVLDLELQGAIARLIELRGRFHNSNDQGERAALGAEISEAARRAILIDHELTSMEEQGVETAPPGTPLDRALAPVTGQIEALRAQAATEKDTLGALGNQPQLVRPTPVTPRDPLVNDSKEAEGTTVRPEEAYSRASDNATQTFQNDLAGRVESQAAEVRGLHDQVIPASPVFTLAEFGEVYRRWFSFFGVAGRDSDPFYRQTKELYAGLFSAVGAGGMEGGMFRVFLMAEMEERVSETIGSASTDFSGQVQTPGRSQSLTGTAASPAYQFAQLFPGTYPPMNAKGEDASRAEYQSIRQQQTKDAFREAAEERSAGRSPSPPLVRGGVTSGDASGVVLAGPQQQDAWHYLIDTIDIFGGVLHEEKTMPPEVSAYLLARAQQRATLAEAHYPGMGDTPTVAGGGLEQGQAVATQVYGEGALAPSNPVTDSNRDFLASSAKGLGIQPHERAATAASRETGQLIREIETYLDKFFEVHPETEYRIAAVLMISEAEFHASAAFMRSLTPKELLKAVGIAMGLNVLKKALSFAGPVGRAAMQMVDAVSSMIGVTTGAALINIAAWLRGASSVSTFHHARVYGFFGSYVADDLGQLVQMYLVNNFIHGLGELAHSPPEINNVQDVIRASDPLMKDPAMRDLFVESVRQEIAAREAKGDGVNTSDPELESLRSAYNELTGQSTGSVEVPLAKDIPISEPAIGGTRDRDVYRVPVSAQTTKKGAVDARRIQKDVSLMAEGDKFARELGGEIVPGTTITAPRGAKPGQLHLSIANPANPKAPISVIVNVEVTAPTDPMWTAGAGGPHGGEGGPARMLSLTKAPSGEWTARVVLHQGLHSDDVPLVLQHEFNEISDILSRNPDATAADIARETEASMFRSGAPRNATPTAHDRAAARELAAMYRDLSNAREAHKPKQDVIADKQARLDRMIHSMGLDDPFEMTDAKRAELTDNGVPPELMTDIEDTRWMAREVGNYGRKVTAFREAQPMMSSTQGVTAPGHFDSKHGGVKAKALAILNSPERVFTGRYEHSGRRVDIYYRDRNVIITDAGQKDVVITGYGPDVDTTGNSGAVDPSGWANNPDYAEIPVQ